MLVSFKICYCLAHILYIHCDIGGAGGYVSVNSLIVCAAYVFYMSGVLSFPFGGVYVLFLFGAGSLILGVLFFVCYL